MRHVTKLFLVIITLACITRLAHADVSGEWVFAVSLGALGSGNAEITLQQEAEGRLTGIYVGQLANGPVTGSHDGNNFEFSFNSALFGDEVTYRGELRGDGTVSGNVLIQGQEIGTFTGTRK